MSRAELDKITPVRPPMVNKNKNPKLNNIGVLYEMRPAQSVANHENWVESDCLTQP
jgi:hypothetical protein